MRAARVRRDFLGREGEWPPHIGFGAIHRIGAHHADDTMRHAIDLNRLADNGAVGAEAANAQGFGENHHAVLARLLLFRSEKSTQNGNDAKNATTNRELAIVRRAFSLAAKCDPPKVARIPSVQLLKENNVRTGFLEYEQYRALRDELPTAIRRLFVVAYHIGGRRGELSSIQWPQVDFAAGQIRLHGTDTKNKEGRTLPIYGEMRDWLTVAKEIRDQKHPTCPWVFYDEKGARLYWFYEEWRAACERAGISGLLFHDLRRSAVRNMERAGIPRKVAMAISGHKTESIYRRYDIVAHRDLTDAAFRLERYFGTLKEDPKGTLTGTPDTEHQAKGENAWTKRSAKLLN